MTDPWRYEDMLADIRAGRRFAFARYCDGEWNAIFGRRGANCDGHAYYPEMGEALRESLITDPSHGYHVGIMPGLLHDTGRWWAAPQVIEYVAACPWLSFCNALMLLSASKAGRLGEFFEALRGWPVTIIGNRHMAGLSPWIEIADMIVVPERDCWMINHDILLGLLETCRVPSVVLFACSMPAKVWIRRAWESRCAATLIDVGAVLDPYVGRMSRGYMREGKAVLAQPLYRK